MKRFLCAILAAALAAAGCHEQRTLYNDAEYVMFASEESLKMIEQDSPSFDVEVASTVACGYDRNFGVEVLDTKSSAVEGVHYIMPSKMVTIKAGERVAKLNITARYDKLEPADTLCITFRLVMPESVKWDLYGDETEVKMVKSCPLMMEDFTGWCVVTSSFLFNYPGTNTSYQRLIRTELHPAEENTVILRNFLYDGYDVSMKLHAGNPAEPRITMDEGQVLSNEAYVFGQFNGDDRILVTHSPYFMSYYDSCSSYAMLYIYVYVEYLGEMIGVVDAYSPTVLEWVSDEEAERLEREDGLVRKW